MKPFTHHALLAAPLACVALWCPPAATAQVPEDTILFAVPVRSRIACEAVPTGQQGVRGYVFEVGQPGARIQTGGGQVLAAAPPPREISLAFDSAGRPLLLADRLSVGIARGVLAMVGFGPADSASGFRQRTTLDSAAVWARLQRDGPSAVGEAVREESRRGPQEPLDSTDLRQARELARFLWERRCP